jgi:ligand-binding sensor domain-containing protein
VLQSLKDGTIYAGMFNEKIEGGAPCLARLASGTNEWEKVGPTCESSVAALWVDPGEPGLVYFSQSNEKGLYRSRDGGENWEKIESGDDLPMTRIGSLAGTADGVLFAGEFVSAAGVYKSTDQGTTWALLEGSPNARIFTLVWVPQQGLLVGGDGGLWLWKTSGEWQQLITLPVAGKVQRILSVAVLPAERFTVLAGGDEGVYLWQEGDPTQSIPKNDEIKQAWSMAVVTKPEQYVIAFTFQNSKIWRMTLTGEDPHEMYEIGSYGLPLIVQQEDPLQLWVGTIDGLYRGELRTRASGLFRARK